MLLPTSARRDYVHYMHKCFHEIYVKTEETMSYLNDSLQNSEYFLQHDLNQEAEDLKVQQQKE